ncbi:MAG: hypothetical protein QXF85_02575 [Candidatus Micrarchaeaceae archaeon]
MYQKERRRKALSEPFSPSSSVYLLKRSHTPIVKVFMRGKVFTMDLDPNCSSKKDWNNKRKSKEHGKEDAKTAL